MHQDARGGKARRSGEQERENDHGHEHDTELHASHPPPRAPRSLGPKVTGCPAECPGPFRESQPQRAGRMPRAGPDLPGQWAERPFRGRRRWTNVEAETKESDQPA